MNLTFYTDFIHVNSIKNKQTNKHLLLFALGVSNLGGETSSPYILMIQNANANFVIQHAKSYAIQKG